MTPLCLQDLFWWARWSNYIRVQKKEKIIINRIDTLDLCQGETMSDVKYRRRGTAIVETDQGILSLLAGVKFSYCPEVEPPIMNQEPKLQ